MLKITPMLVVAAVVATGCATKPHPVAIENLGPVLDQIKAELRAYNNWISPPVRGVGGCYNDKKGRYHLTVTQAAVDLSTTDTKSESVALSGVNVDLIAFTGPSFTSTAENSQAMTFQINVNDLTKAVTAPREPTKDDFATNPLASVIYRTLEQIAGADHGEPCFSFTRPDGEKPLKIVIGFDLTKKGQGGASFGLAPVQIGLTGSSQSEAIHKITLYLQIDPNQPQGMTY